MSLVNGLTSPSSQMKITIADWKTDGLLIKARILSPFSGELGTSRQHNKTTTRHNGRLPVLHSLISDSQ